MKYSLQRLEPPTQCSQTPTQCNGQAHHTYPTHHPSFIRIQLGPDLLNMLALLLRRLAILARPLEPQPAQTHVDFVLGVGAVPGYFPQEAARVAFVEGGDDFGAAWGC